MQLSQTLEGWRDMDYLVQTNFLAFLILWKAKRFEQSQKYISLAKRYVYQFYNEQFGQNEDLKQNAAGTLENTSEVPNKEIMDYLLLSDTEENPIKV